MILKKNLVQMYIKINKYSTFAFVERSVLKQSLINI